MKNHTKFNHCRWDHGCWVHSSFKQIENGCFHIAWSDSDCLSWTSDTGWFCLPYYISFHIAVALYIVTHSLLFSPTLSVASFLELCVLFHCLTFLLSTELFYPTQAYFESIQREKSFNLFVCFEKLQTLFLVWKHLK